VRGLRRDLGPRVGERDPRALRRRGLLGGRGRRREAGGRQGASSARAVARRAGRRDHGAGRDEQPATTARAPHRRRGHAFGDRVRHLVGDFARERAAVAADGGAAVARAPVDPPREAGRAERVAARRRQAREHGGDDAREHVARAARREDRPARRVADEARPVGDERARALQDRDRVRRLRDAAHPRVARRRRLAGLLAEQPRGLALVGRQDRRRRAHRQFGEPTPQRVQRVRVEHERPLDPAREREHEVLDGGRAAEAGPEHDDVDAFEVGPEGVVRRRVELTVAATRQAHRHRLRQEPRDGRLHRPRHGDARGPRPAPPRAASAVRPPCRASRRRSGRARRTPCARPRAGGARDGAESSGILPWYARPHAAGARPVRGPRRARLGVRHRRRDRR
jgi:hypothetical protein